MKLKILSAAALLALAGSALSPSAQAQFVSANSGGAANSEDLILSFKDTNAADGTTATTTNYEIDLGNVDQYLTATSTFTIANVATDLGNTFSSSYYTDSGISLGILGVNNSTTTDNTNNLGINPSSIFVSVSNPSSPFPADARSTQNSTYTQVDKIYSPSAGTPAPTDGTTAGSFLVATTNGSSFNSVNTSDGLNTGNSVSLGGSTPQLYLETLTYGTGGPTSSGTATVDTAGYFTLTSGGNINFVVAATPEPSTCAMMFLGAAALIWRTRRQKVSSL